MKLILEFVKIHIKSRLIFRASAIVGILTAFIKAWISIYIILGTIYSRVDSILGWKKEEIILLQGVMMTLYYLVNFLFVKGLEGLSRDVEMGTLDTILTRPVDPLIIVISRFPGIFNFSRMFVGIAVFIYGIKLTNPAGNIYLSGFSLVLSFIILTLLYTISYSVAFWNYRVYMLYTIVEDFIQFGHYPVEIFGRFLKWLFFTVIPVGVVSSFPAMVILGRGDPSKIIVHQTIVAMVFYVLVKIMWRLGLRRYESIGN